MRQHNIITIQSKMLGNTSHKDIEFLFHSRSVVGMGTSFVETTLANVTNPLNNVMVTVVQLRLKHLITRDLYQ